MSMLLVDTLTDFRREIEKENLVIISQARIIKGNDFRSDYSICVARRTVKCLLFVVSSYLAINTYSVQQ